jgi:hypothetical protein
MLAWLSAAKLYAIGAALAVALFAVVLWRAYAKGQQAAVADAAIEGLNKVIKANNAKRNAVDTDHDPWNRDNWGMH